MMDSDSWWKKRILLCRTTDLLEPFSFFFFPFIPKGFSLLWLIFSLVLLHLNDGCQDWKKGELRSLLPFFSLSYELISWETRSSNWIDAAPDCWLLARPYIVLFWRKLVCSSCCIWMLSMTSSSSSLGHFVYAERIGSFPVDCVLLLWTRCRAGPARHLHGSLSAPKGGPFDNQ